MIGCDHLVRLMRDRGRETLEGNDANPSRSGVGEALGPRQARVQRDRAESGVRDRSDICAGPGPAGACACFLVNALSRIIVGWRSRRVCAPRSCATRSRWPASHMALTTKIYVVMAMQVSIHAHSRRERLARIGATRSIGFVVVKLSSVIHASGGTVGRLVVCRC